MPFVYDYIVVGAGPAGCICAGELKKKGYTVCALERQAPDHRKVCGDGISDVCVRLLRAAAKAKTAPTTATPIRVKCR